MSYTEAPNSFSGMFRDLDIQFLVKLYGISPEYNSGENIYRFNDKKGTFIVDSGGIDEIQASEDSFEIYINLNPGTHSYMGEKSNHITDPNQLTISSGSLIENVFTGSGNDYVIGNEIENYVSTGSGNDRIFLSEGSDVVNSGSGSDIIDLSELSQSRDTVIIEKTSVDNDFDLIIGFIQGFAGDIIDLSDFKTDTLEMLPVIHIDDVPHGYISNYIVRMVGNNLSEPNFFETAFEVNESLSNLNLNVNSSTFLITANSQVTGEDQNLFFVNRTNQGYEAVKLAQFIGNYLDIDSWNYDNFFSSNTDQLI